MQCAKCGNTDKFYRKGQIQTSVPVFYDRDKSYRTSDYSNLGVLDELKGLIKESKYYYCDECDQRVERVADDLL